MLRTGARVAGAGLGLEAANLTPGIKDLNPWLKYGLGAAAGGYAANPILLAKLSEWITSPQGQKLLGGLVANTAQSVATVATVGK